MLEGLVIEHPTLVFINIDPARETYGGPLTLRCYSGRPAQSAARHHAYGPRLEPIYHGPGGIVFSGRL